MENTINLLGIQSISQWCEASSSECKDLDSWDMFRISYHEKACVRFWHVFLRRSLSVRFRTSSVVAIDFRKSVLLKPFRS